MIACFIGFCSHSFHQISNFGRSVSFFFFRFMAINMHSFRMNHNHNFILRNRGLITVFISAIYSTSLGNMSITCFYVIQTTLQQPGFRYVQNIADVLQMRILLHALLLFIALFYAIKSYLVCKGSRAILKCFPFLRN